MPIDTDLLLSREEWEAWQGICQALKDQGAVTEDDLGSPVSQSETPGQQLLTMIRNWGKLRAAQGKAV